MQIPAGATSFVPDVSNLHPGIFRKGQIRHTYRVNGTHDWLLMLTTSGEGLFRFQDGSEFTSRRGDLVVYQPEAFQDYQAATQERGWSLIFAHFLARREWVEWLDWPLHGPGLAHLHIAEPLLYQRLKSRLTAMVNLSLSGRPRAKSFGLNALEEVLLWCDTINPRRGQAHGDPRIQRAIEYLHSNLTKTFDEKSLCHAAGLSPSRLRFLFRRHTGFSPREYQERQRLLRARDLLALSSQRIGELASELGFENPFYFTLRFKKMFGQSPRATRSAT